MHYTQNHLPAAGVAALLVASSCLATVYIEDFKASPGGDCAIDPMFNHQFSGTTGLFTDGDGNCHLELLAGEDFITFNLPPGHQVFFAQVTLLNGCVSGTPCPVAFLDGETGSITWSVDPRVVGPTMFTSQVSSAGAVESITLSSANMSAWDNVLIVVGTPDLNGDGVVGGLDLAILLGAWGACPPGPPGTPCDADFNGDAMVNGSDLAMLLAVWD